ncbi:RDD family protein [Pedobacter jeongneungensis]|uniref:RDD family protein n=1 Tax=Pedobacter jeongneungensis TaxID=947309 RepID=UPI00046A3418|nr:RDD family protein [Pedobacter jeongneungensis]
MDFNNNYQEIDLSYCRASSGKRLANYIIDLIVFYIILFGIYICIGILLPGILDGINDLLDRLIAMVCYGFIMCLIEAVSRGKSIGKLITGTKAVNLDGSDIDFGKAFTRNMIRVIPFNAISALSNPCDPWHDRWSDTMVVDEKKMALQTQRVDLFDSVKNQIQ